MVRFTSRSVCSVVRRLTTLPPAVVRSQQNTNQFNSGSVCGQYITLTYNGATGTALIADECPSSFFFMLSKADANVDHFVSFAGCSYGEIDLSPSFFQSVHLLDSSANEALTFGPLCLAGTSPLRTRESSTVLGTLDRVQQRRRRRPPTLLQLLRPLRHTLLPPRRPPPRRPGRLPRRPPRRLTPRPRPAPRPRPLPAALRLPPPHGRRLSRLPPAVQARDSLAVAAQPTPPRPVRAPRPRPLPALDRLRRPQRRTTGRALSRRWPTCSTD